MNKQARLMNLVEIVGSTVSPFEGEKKYVSTGDSEDIESSENVKFHSKPSRANLKVKPTDVLITKMKNTNKTIHIDEELAQHIYSTGFFAINSKLLNNRYLYYLLSSDEAMSEKDSYCFGTTQMAINEVGLKKIVVNYVVDLEQQQKIANFLDQKSFLIDHIIEKTKESIKEYEQYKRSLIVETVTGGLNPDVEMKDSGIEWIGEIPEHWDVVNLSRLYSQVKEKNEGLVEDNLLSLSYGRIVKKDIRSNEGLLPASFEGYNIITSGNIVLRLTDLQNDHTSLRVGFCTQTGIITSAYISLKGKGRCIDKYVYYYLHSFDICKGFYGMGAGVRQSLTFDGIKNLKLLLAPTIEQQQIVKYLDEKCSQVDKVIKQKEKFVREFKAYKKSLIYEYVTGKRQVDEVAKKGDKVNKCKIKIGE